MLEKLFYETIQFFYFTSRKNFKSKLTNDHTEQQPPDANGHYFLVPRVVVVHRFDCNCKFNTTYSFSKFVLHIQ